MDFVWVPDIPHTRKQIRLPTDNNTTSNESLIPRLYTPTKRSRADTMPTSTFDISSPLDENASNSIASTLASLGLNDEPRHNIYTAKDDMMSFQKTNRPRAISLGMAEAAPISLPPSFQQFSPFNDYQKIHLDNSFYQHNLFSKMDAHQEEMDHKTMMDYYNNADMILDDPTPQSRALWLGNINPSLSVPDLHKMFAPYGHVESARILSDKECAFVNFSTAASAFTAKEDLVNRLGSKVAGSVVKVGYGKADVDVAMALTNEAGPNAQGPTRALWVGNIPADINPAVLRSLFQLYGPIESIRILSHKNCGFVNFERQEDAVRARKMMQNREILGPGTGTVRIGFAKSPASDEVGQDVVISGTTVTSYPFKALSKKSSRATLKEEEAPETTQWATVLLMASMMMNATSTSSSSTTNKVVTERKLIMQQLGLEMSPEEEQRIPITYHAAVPTLPEFGANRSLGPSRLREIRKALDNGHISDIELVARECMHDIVELCSDYIGNTVVQRLFESCCEETKSLMLAKIAPYIASIGIHKNGTWVAQKLIDTTTAEDQIDLICTNIAPYVPLLLLDRFGNYVVQCCLCMGPIRNQYIFDAVVEKCWEIGQGRFGARAVRAILENPVVTKEQQIFVASAIMQNALVLTTNPNGSILLNWLLDSSGLLSRT